MAASSRAIQRRIEAGQLADAVTLRAEFEHSGLLDEVGGPAYLAQLLTAMVGIINAGEYGRVIHDCWLRRQLIDVGESVVNRAFGAEPELDAQGSSSKPPSRALFDLAKDGGAEGGFVSFERALADAVRACGDAPSPTPAACPACPPGCATSTRKTGGLHPSDLLILAGRPGMGKTALATKIAFGAAQAAAARGAGEGPERGAARRRRRSSRWK